MQHRRIIKQGPIVLATNEDGSMDPTSASSQGLFRADTRYLSTFRLRINDSIPLLLGSTEEDLYQASFLQTNDQVGSLSARGVGILQRNSISGDCVRIEVTLANWSLKPVSIELSMEVDSDFFDSFEARGVKRLKRGEVFPAEVSAKSVKLRYLGLDKVTRTTEIRTTPDMRSYDSKCMRFCLDVGLNERKTVTLELQLHEEPEDGIGIQASPEIAAHPTPDWFSNSAHITVDNARISAVLDRSVEDLQTLLMEFPEGWVPAAGLPRFGVPFGRDSIITAIETLMWNPRMAHDTLRFLAARQGKENNPWNYEQPGKIMHEMHTGELARLKEVPFGLFYGSVDATPLFLVLAGEYIRWTSDLDLYHGIEENLEAAWEWIDKYGQIDGSGYIQYQAHTPPELSSAALTVGLFNQGWKDNALAVMYSNGTMVTDHPIALAEVQGYYFRALHVWSGLLQTMPGGDEKMRQRGAEFGQRAARLKERFNRDFWMEDKQYYAMALDGHHRHVDSITSNPGQCLWSRIIDVEHAKQTADVLLSDPMFTSWGIRTMASTELAYNPFSYHDGSIWPFDNAIIAAGLKKYGFVEETQRVFDGLIEASVYFEYRRWPEVYCGVSRSIGGVLARQPDASRPQAWSAGAIFLFLQTILGMAPRPFSKHVDITPALPSCMNELIVDGVSVAGGTLGIRLVRQYNSVLMEIRDNPTELDIVIHPPMPGAVGHASAQGPAVSR